ncbi:7701_t:CDS:2, partial [Paraglomus occultum]
MANIDNGDRGDTNGMVSNSTPDIVVSSSSSRRSAYLGNPQTSAQYIQQLQEQLKDKIKQTQLTAALGQDLLVQQEAIRKRIEELEQIEGDVPPELKSKLNELEEAAKALDARTQNLEGASTSATNVGHAPLTSTPPASEASALSQQAANPSRNRRQRNANRNHDMEFATSIGQKALKSENYSLYGEIQSLEGQIKELNDNIDKLQKDLKKGEKALASATDLIEQLKAKEAKLTNQLDDYKKRHDEAMSNNRKLRAAMKREIESLERVNEELRKELDKYKVPKKPSASAASGTEATDAQSPGHTVEFVKETVEIRDTTMEALQNAQKMIAQMKITLQKEKNEKLEIKELLQAREEEIESLRNNLDFGHDPASRNRRRDKAAEEDDVLSDDVMSHDGYDDENINKNNRPSSDMFRRGPPITRNGSNRSFRRTKLLLDGQVEEQDEEDMLAMERDELITGEVIKRDADGNVIPQSTESYEGLDPNEVQAERAAALSLLTKGKSPTEQLANSEARHDRQSSVGSFDSTAESFASAKESNAASVSRRGSAMSLRRESAFIPSRGSKAVSAVGGSKRGADEVKTFADAETQTDLAKLEIGTQTIDSLDYPMYDETRFTLDLSSKANARGKGSINSTDVPPRPPFGPPEETLRRANSVFLSRPTSPLSRNSTVSMDKDGNLIISNGMTSDGVPQYKSVPPIQSLAAQGSRSVPGAEEITPKVDGRPMSPDHKHSPSSVSTSSTDSTATEKSRPLSGSSVADLTTGTENMFRSGTDPTVIQFITQTMIGEFMHKYTRRKFGTPAKRNRRFFWVHPFTKILYWSDKDPGGRDGDSKVQVQAAYIAGVRQENDSNPFPRDLYGKSIVVMTRGGREVKFTAKDKERHDLWYQALHHLVNDAADTGMRSRAGSDELHLDNETTSPNGTLRSNNLQREIKKKSSFSQIKDFLRRDRQSGTQSPHHLSHEADLNKQPPMGATSRDVP